MPFDKTYENAIVEAACIRYNRIVQTYMLEGIYT